MTRGRQAALGLTAVAVLVVAVLVGRSVISGPSTPAAVTTKTSPATTPSTTATTTTGARAPYPPAGYTAFRDDPAGFEISYPSTWTRLHPTDDRQVDLLVSHGTAATNGVTMLVRVSPLGLPAPTTRAGLKKVRPLTDAIVHAGGFAHVIGKPKEIVLDHVPGYLYLYVFSPGSGQAPVAHAHYFFFKGDALIAVVFQIAPAEALAKLAPELDVVARTFRATSR